MTGKELFTKTLKCEPVGGQVPTFELAFFLTMEAFGKLYPGQRVFHQWDQMSAAEKKLHIDDIAATYIASARRYGHSAIFVQSEPWCWQEKLDKTRAILSAIREQSGNEFFLMLHGDADPVVLYEDTETLYNKLNECGCEAELVRVTNAPHEGNFWSPELLEIIFDFIQKKIG